eukprot:CAMPEP_0197027444 /NCGR_PEP_ID=MMETSP1384-20130603/7341_1 /TAXON_ID=29189 /ORGANISM="Ammonia sp." /LENGTH=396 /DNA_ID=CAMNT_0042456285 /DNA_START=63 /DNA_END=1254 /DNA_ORIENTATION=-
MANAANSPFVKHPALLALFAPRPAPPFRAPMPTKSTSKISGIAQFTEQFAKDDDEVERAPPQKFETAVERTERLQREKEEAHLRVLAEREKNWDPHNNPNSTKDPYKTLFVARLSYELTEEDLRREFERYGRIRDVKLILDKDSQKSRGYAFIEFERSNDLKEAFQHADGVKLKGRRILVDVERGRTVKTWKPRKLGGGLGKTRAGPSNGEKMKASSSASSPSRQSSRSRGKPPREHPRRDKDKDTKTYGGGGRGRDSKYRERDYRDGDRDRRSGRVDRGDRRDREKERGGERMKDRERRRSRSRSRDRVKDSSRSKRRDRKERDTKDRDRDRDRDRSRMDNGAAAFSGDEAERIETDIEIQHEDDEADQRKRFDPHEDDLCSLYNVHRTLKTRYA